MRRPDGGVCAHQVRTDCLISVAMRRHQVAPHAAKYRDSKTLVNTHRHPSLPQDAINRDFGSGGWGFESLPARHLSRYPFKAFRAGGFKPVARGAATGRQGGFPAGSRHAVAVPLFRGEERSGVPFSR